MDVAAAKIGIYGEAGAGKTRTATEIAIGLAKATGSPIAFFDTEGGASFMVRLCEDAGVELLVAKARAFADLMTFTKEATDANAVAIVDSISHTWDDLRESYERRLKRKNGLEIWDWGVIKPAWREFTTAYLTSPIHMIVCGRAASIYEQVYNEARGKSEVQVVGSKMKTEKETAYEPSLLIEMERAPQHRVETEKIHVVATIVKDRSDMMDGQSFADPTYETFAPFFSAINIGGEHKPTDASRNSDHMFSTPDNAIERKRQVEITLEKVKDAFILADIGTQSQADKKRMRELLLECFGTSAWTEIEGQYLQDLQSGLVALRKRLGHDAEEMEDDELDAIGDLMKNAAEAGLISKEDAAKHFALVLDKRYDELRRIRDEIVEKMKPEGVPA